MSEGIERGAERTPSLGRRLRPIGIGGLAAVVLVILALGTASAAPALTTATATKSLAPYPGSGLGGFENFAEGCGSTAAVSSLPIFNTSNGIGTLSAKATSKNCGSAASNRSLELSVVYVSPSFSTTTGSHNITADWLVTFIAKLAATGTTGHPATGIFEVSALSLLVDETNDSTIKTSSALVAFNEITTGTYSHTFSKVAAKLSTVATLKKTQKYDYELEVLVLLGTSVAPGGTSASASVTMSGGANGATLKSVTVT